MRRRMRSAPLTAVGFSRAAAAHDGHRLALELGGLALLQAAVVAALARRIVVSERVRRAYVGVLAAGAAALLVLAVVQIGNPATFVARATDSFKSDKAPTGGHLGTGESPGTRCATIRCSAAARTSSAATGCVTARPHSEH